MTIDPQRARLLAASAGIDNRKLRACHADLVLRMIDHPSTPHTIYGRGRRAQVLERGTFEQRHGTRPW